MKKGSVSLSMGLFTGAALSSIYVASVLQYSSVRSASHAATWILGLAIAGFSIGFTAGELAG
ncbi:MAG: hypothetical protein ABEI07_00860 [Candidatus Nanohaloarchaea archaeon]